MATAERDTWRWGKALLACFDELRPQPVLVHGEEPSDAGVRLGLSAPQSRRYAVDAPEAGEALRAKLSGPVEAEFEH